jgi:hypothetical protein
MKMLAKYAKLIKKARESQRSRRVGVRPRRSGLPDVFEAYYPDPLIRDLADAVEELAEEISERKSI